MTSAKQELDYYSILNVNRDATTEEIALAYRKLAVKYHPQRDPGDCDYPENPPEGIDEENHLPGLSRCQIWFLINQAYSVLSNHFVRGVYDRYGDEGLREGVTLPNGFFYPYIYHGIPMKTYQEVFGSYLPYRDIIDAVVEPPPLYKYQGKINIKTKDDPIEKTLFVDLKEIFHGTQKRMKILRREFINEEATRTEIREKILIVPIAPGIPVGTRITFREESDRNPTTIPADIIFIISDKEHDTFRREGSDLHMNYEISLRHAFCGFQLRIKTIDGRRLNLSVLDVISPGDVKVIPHEGIPKYGLPDEKGDLYVHFTVKYPKSIPRELKITLSELLKEIEKRNAQESLQYSAHRNDKHTCPRGRAQSEMSQVRPEESQFA